MIVTHVRIANVLGIEALEFDTGRLTRVSGDNGRGKSSIVSAIQAALGGGNPAHLVREGAEKAEVVLVFDDGYEVAARIGPSGTKRVVKTPEGAVITAPAKWIEARLNMLAFNPLSFLEASPQRRIEQLLAVARLELTAGRLHEAYGGCALAADKPHPHDGHPSAPDELVGEPLAVLEHARADFYAQRAVLNRLAKEKRGHAGQLAAAVGGADGPPPDVEALRAALTEVRREAAAERARIGKEEADARQRAELAARSRREEASLEADAAERAARRDFEARMAEIAQQRQAAHAAAAAEEKQAILRAADAAKIAVAAVEARLKPKHDELAGRIPAAEQARAAFERARQTREAIARAEREVAELLEEAERLTGAIGRLDAVRAGLMARLPVPGLEVKDGELRYNGIRFETLNTAEQIDVSLRLAEAAAGTIKLICLDGLERLGRAKREAFESRAVASDCQFIVTRVVDDADLTIETGAAATTPAA